MHPYRTFIPHGGYDWSRFGRHRLRAAGGVLIDSPLGPAGHGWLGTLWLAGDPLAWSRMLWTPDPELGGWIVPGRLAGGDVIEFGADRTGQAVRWYGIVDSYDAVEWLTLQGPYPDPCAAHQHAQQLLGHMRYRSPNRAHRTQRRCSRTPSRRR